MLIYFLMVLVLFGLAQLSSTACAETLLMCAHKNSVCHTSATAMTAKGLRQSHWLLWLHRSSGHGEGTGRMAGPPRPEQSCSPFTLCRLPSAQGADKRLWSLGRFCSEGSVGPTVCREVLSYQPPNPSPRPLCAGTWTPSSHCLGERACGASSLSPCLLRRQLCLALRWVLLCPGVLCLPAL